LFFTVFILELDGRVEGTDLRARKAPNPTSGAIPDI